MIRKSGSGYKVYSRKGKALSRTLSHGGAVKRLRQVEYHKAHQKRKRRR
jgi:hypothetical protein